MLLQKSNYSNESPFDSIRHFDQNGEEFWFARELMQLMGYQKWERFENPIRQSVENLELNGDNVSDHFFPLARKSQGRDATDYKLTRYACYMIALCCDGRKVEVAGAKKYFAIRTRQAEVQIPQQSERIRELELQNEVLAKQLELRQLDNTMLTLHGKETVLALRGMADQIVETEKPTIEVIDERHNVKFKGQTLVQIRDYVAKKYGIKFKTGVEIKRYLEQRNLGDLIAQTPRTCLSDYVPEENLEQVYKVITNSSRQLLLGE